MTANSQIDGDRTPTRWMQSGFYATSIVFNLCLIAQLLTVGVAYFNNSAWWDVHIWLVRGYSGLSFSTEHAQAQQIAFVNAARQSGVMHIVKLSQFGAEASSPGRFLRYHAAVEAALQASGMAYTFLRPNLFMQGLLNFRSTIATQNAFYAAANDAQVSAVDVRDIADVAVAALTEAGHENKIYDLTDLQSLTHAQMAEYLSAALGRQIAFVDVSPEAMHDFLLSAKFPLWQADGLLEEYAHYRRNEAAAIASGVRDVIAKEPRSFEAFARDYAAMFS